ncbi:MAG TPA: S1 RNA-binding domain-containing protein, partial [Herpetosiphonaceae bacterium]|nr:S1 RNA-binding domain-containing protein [Herpetosiphonaceae bacterium]
MTDAAQNTSADNGSDKDENKDEGLVSKVVDKVRDVASEVREEVGEFVGEAREEVGEFVGEAREKAGELIEEVKERVGIGSDAEPAAEAAPVAADASAADAAPAEETSGGLAGVFNSVKEAVSNATSSVVETAKNVLGVTGGNDESTGETLAETAAETVAAAAPAAASQVAGAQADAEGASFEPTSDDGATPRRLADLEPGMELEGRVTSTALYGIFVDIGVGRDGLVHISEMSDQRIESPTDLVQIGETVKVRIKSVDADARRISLTMRTPRSESGEGRRRSRAPKRPEVNLERLGEINPGDLIEGTVNGIAPFGVFVDIGVGKDGLVHISELADGRVEKAEDAVTVGQSYTFRVLEVDAEGQRISLSLRRAQEGYQERPRSGGSAGGGGRRREANLDAIAPGTILEGKVSGIAPFGAFVDLGVGRDGLVHISELAEGRIGKVEDVVNVGDPVKVRVIEVDPSSKRISLSMRLEVPVGPVSTSGSSRLDRDWTNPAERGGSGGARGGSGGARGGSGG